MKKFGTLFVVFFFFSFSFASDLKEGLWEMSVKMEMKGMNMPMPAQKFKQCITKEKMIPHEGMEKEKKDDKCKVVEQKVSGNKIFWKIVCKEKEGQTVITGTGVYNFDNFEGESRIKTPDGMEMTQKMSGKWIGKCK